MSDAVLGAVCGIIGTILGTVLGFVLSERATRRREAQKKAEEEAEFQLFAVLSVAAKEGKVLMPEPGSEQQRLAEKLAVKGMLERLPGGAYGIPGQSFVIDTKS